jgi:branched-chain amino acid transport system substrate-binding protein
VADTRGDPADAVPAAQKLIATSGNLEAIIGPSSDEASSTIPLFNRAQIPAFPNSGQVVFDHSTLPYFWRPFPADDANGYAMALWAKQRGFTRVGAVFGNDISSQGSEPTAKTGMKALGGQVILTQNVPLKLSSYRTEVQQMMAAHPQAIFMEADPQTSSTYLTELKQLGGVVPVIGTQGTANTPWERAVEGALGAAAFDKLVTVTFSYAPTSGPAWTTYRDAVKAAPGVEKPLSQWYADAYSMGGYDSVVICSLAMLKAHSTSPAKFNQYIMGITKPSPGAQIVHTFAEGKAALAQGKPIEYDGATGALDFNKYHNSNGDFEVLGFTGGLHQHFVRSYSAKDFAPFGTAS